MDLNLFPDPLPKPDPHNFEETTSAPNDLITAIWEAAEWLGSRDLMRRVAAYNRLMAYDAARQLPLIAYIFVTRLIEPDIELRTRIVKTLGSMVSASRSPGELDDRVYNTLMDSLAEIRTREVFALLQVAEYDKTAESSVADLMGLCSFAGGHLAQILSNRTVEIEIRRQAAYFIGLLGYLEALPVLERMAARLESKGDEDENSILPVLQNAVLQLTAV